MASGLITLRKDARELRRLRHWLRGWLAETLVPTALGDRVVLATHEAALAQIKHATAVEDIEIRTSVDEQHTLTIDITDGGDWLVGDALEDARPTLALIRNLVDEVVILPNARQTTIRLYQDLGRPEHAATLTV